MRPEESQDSLFGAVEYTDDNIRHLSDMEHVRTRPGMYIGRLGDGSQAEDGIYVLMKEVIDNSIDEFKMGTGKRIEVNIEDNLRVTVRDYGRGIPLGKLVEAVSMLNTGGKYDSKAFKKSVGLNGVGLKAVNALSLRFEVASTRDGETRRVVFEQGQIKSDETTKNTDETGTFVHFEPDESLFRGYAFRPEFVETMLRNYTYLNTGLTILFNGRRIVSREGLSDLLTDRMNYEALYPIIHLRGEDIEVAFTHTKQSGEEYFSFVNGQYTSSGGTHQAAFKKYVAEVIRDYSGKNIDFIDIRNGLTGSVSINIQEPLFESQTKVKLGSLTTQPDGGQSIDKFIGDFLKKELDNYLHRNPDVADIIVAKAIESEKIRKEMAGVAKKAREMNKKASLHNRKLRDCRVHLTDQRGDKQELSSIFITEGDSASGSITKSRDANTQAVFSLRGKPKNVCNKTKKEIYENEELNLLMAALNIEDGLENLRYNRVIVATDADVDGMHIRLLMLTFFLQFFPELVKKGHVYILQTPLFRVRTRKPRQGKFVTRYCYSEQERQEAIRALGPEPEITRFKGLGEISPDEFSHFIGPEMRLERVKLQAGDNIGTLLEYYMGKNTLERQQFIIENLVFEEDRPEEIEAYD